MPDYVQIRGARVHNLKNIDIDIPLGKLAAVSGLPCGACEKRCPFAVPIVENMKRARALFGS